MNVLTIDPIVSKESLGAKAPIFDISASCLSIAATEPPSETHADISAQLLMPPTIEEPLHCADIATTVVASSAAGLPALPVHIYPKAAFDLLKLKCPTVRRYCSNDSAGSMSDALRSGLNRSLAAFEDGPDHAHRACSRLSDFNQVAFDADMAAGCLPGAPRYTCAQARADGSTTCPAQGCPLPDRKIAEASVDLLTWDCNIQKLGHTIIASSIVASEFGSALISVRDKLYVYEQGIYKEVNDTELGNKTLPHLGQMATSRHVVEIGKILRMGNVQRMESIKPDPNFICFTNGTLNVETHQLEAHDPAHMLLNRIEHPYVPTASCTGFLHFLGTTFHGDADCEQKIQVLRQWFGYLLVADISLQKMLILKGDGANGKSVVVDLASDMVGPENTTGAMLHRLRMPYVRATLEGKLLNISADLPKVGSVADGDMKAIVVGDGVEVSPKHKPSYRIRPYARLMVATNHLPDSKDSSEGYFRRLIILNFNNMIPVNERNPRLLQSLLVEMPGIIAWAVEGLYDLRGQERFTIPSSSEQAALIYQDDVSPVRIFANECLTRSPDRSGYSSRDIFMAYRAWGRDRGFGADNMITLGRDLAQLGFESRKSSHTIWMVQVKESGEEYFMPAQIVPSAVIQSAEI